MIYLYLIFGFIFTGLVGFCVWMVHQVTQEQYIHRIKGKPLDLVTDEEKKYLIKHGISLAGMDGFISQHTINKFHVKKNGELQVTELNHLEE